MSISHAGRYLLDRRTFLQFAGTGLGGIALAHLLADERSSIRPNVRPDAPLAPDRRTSPRKRNRC